MRSGGGNHTVNSKQVNLLDEDGNIVGVQHPLSTNGDSVYPKDVDTDESIFDGWTGDILDLFMGLLTTVTHTGPDNPKTFTVFFKRTVITNSIGFGTASGSFSNLKLIGIASGGFEVVLFDGSADDTDRTTQTVLFFPLGVSGFRVEFHTSDEVSLSNMVILKTISTVARLQGISDLTGSVENVSTYRGALNVNSAFVHRKIVNEIFHQHVGTPTTLASPATAGDTSIVVVSATGMITGDKIKIEEGALQEIGVLTLTNVVGTTLTLDRPIANDYTTAAGVSEVITNMIVDGTLSSPEIFEIDPPPGTVWQITRLLISLTHTTAGDNSKFGNIAPLDNGVALRTSSAAGRTVVYANWKTNKDMKLDMYDVEYTDKAGPGLFGTDGRWTFTRSEIVLELDGDAAPVQSAQVLVQDLLDTISGLVTFEIKAQGRVFSP